MGFTWTNTDAPERNPMRRWAAALRDLFRPPHLSARMLDLIDRYH